MLAFAAALAVLGQGNAHSDTLTFRQGDGGAYSATAATFLEERARTTNRGGEALVKLEEEYRTNNPSSHFLYQGLVGFFDVIGTNPGQIPPNATINSATLTLNFSDAGSAGAPVTVHQMLKGWVENEVTWTQLKNGSPFGNVPFTPTQGPALNPGGGAPGTDYVSTPVDSKTAPAGARDFNLTTVLQAWANGASNFGVYLRYRDTNGAQFHSDDAATLANRPLLTIDYTDPNPDVILTASSPTGATVLQPGGTFNVDLTWSGPESAAAADYAVTLNTSQLLLTGRTVNGILTPYVDTPYHPSFPATTNRIDVTWFKKSGFTGKDVTLHFQVPADYSGPSAITVDLAIGRVEDSGGTELKSFTYGTTLNANQYDPGNPGDPYVTWAGGKNLTAANNAPGFDADLDGFDNRTEFAFNGDPLSGSSKGMFFYQLVDTAVDVDTDKELAFTCAVRSGAVFSVNANNAQLSAAIDGLVYTIEGSSTLAGTWAAPIVSVGASYLPPAGSGLPDLSGSGWEYRTFSGFNGIPLRGFIRAGVSAP